MTVEQLITNNLDLWTSAVAHKKTSGRGSSAKRELTGIKKLRELILELAVRGKLVPQDAGDEPAETLVGKIEVEKGQLLKAGEVKSSKKLPPICPDESLDLPSSWTSTRLGSISNYGATEKAEPSDASKDTWVLELEDIEKESSKLLNRVTFADREFRSSKNRFKAGDVLYGKLRPYLDKVLVADGEGVCTTEIIPIHFYGSIAPEYMRVVLKSPQFKTYANDSTHGMNLPRLGTEKARRAVVPLPPLAEQHRIVQKVDELMALCDQLEQQTGDQIEAHERLVETLLDTLTRSASATELAENWTRIQQHFDTLFTTEHSIDRLKQTILQLAVMGRLVPQDSENQSASEFLAELASVKRDLVANGKIKRTKDRGDIDDEKLPYELPTSWSWCRLPDIGELARGKSKHRPRNDPALYENGDVPLIQTGDVARANREITTYTAKYNDVGLAQSKLWSRGTLCITIAANIGDTGILAFDACFPDSVVGFKSFDERLRSEYVEYFLRTAKQHLNEFAPSTAQKNINLEVLERLLVPLPPPEETSRIIERVDELMSMCDSLIDSLDGAAITRCQLAKAVADHAVH